MKTPMEQEDVVSGDQVIPSGRFVVAEYTTDMGPMTNDYFLCLAFENGETIERVPGDSHRNERLFRELEARCGSKLKFGQLVNSTDYATVILHPLELCDFPYFEFLDRLGENAGGLSKRPAAKYHLAIARS